MPNLDIECQLNRVAILLWMVEATSNSGNGSIQHWCYYQKIISSVRKWQHHSASRGTSDSILLRWLRSPAPKDGWKPMNGGMLTTVLNWWFGFLNHPPYVQYGFWGPSSHRHDYNPRTACQEKDPVFLGSCWDKWVWIKHTPQNKVSCSVILATTVKQAKHSAKSKWYKLAPKL